MINTKAIFFRNPLFNFQTENRYMYLQSQSTEGIEYYKRNYVSSQKTNLEFIQLKVLKCMASLNQGLKNQSTWGTKRKTENFYNHSSNSDC